MKSNEVNCPPISDGRRERTSITRRRILAASRELILAGNLEPTAVEIASRVGVTTRTLFRHFPDMESLYRQIVADAESQAQAVMDEPFPESITLPGKWPDQIRLVIERRARLYEHLLPLFVSPVFQRYRMKSSSGKAARATVSRRRTRLTQVLPPELTKDKLLFEAIDGIFSIEFWISLRQDQQLSASRAAHVVQRATERMIGITE